MAVEWYGHFDSTEDDPRILTAESWARSRRHYMTDGIRNGGTNLQVTSPNDGMKIHVAEGVAIVDGYGYEVMQDHAEDTTYLELDIPEAHPIRPRIDRVVLRLDRRISERKITSEIKIGTASNTPKPPELERNANIFELSLAKVKVPSGALSILPENITDERLNSKVCGLINSLIQADTEEMYRDFQDKFKALIDGMQGDFDGLEETFIKMSMELLKEKRNEMDKLISDVEAEWARIKANIVKGIDVFDFDNLASFQGADLDVTYKQGGKKEKLHIAHSGFLIATRETFYKQGGKVVKQFVYDEDGETILEQPVLTTTYSQGKKKVTVR